MVGRRPSSTAASTDPACGDGGGDTAVAAKGTACGDELNAAAAVKQTPVSARTAVAAVTGGAAAAYRYSNLPVVRAAKNTM